MVYNETPMVMEQRHIDEIVAGFGQSAANAKAAGLDGVEIHAAHNQCVGEFLSPGFNKRDDRYGGSVENRCRLLLEIAAEIRRRTGDDFTVGVRMSFDEFLGEHGGITPEDCEAQLEVLAGADLLDFFDISGGGYHTLHIAVAPMGSVEEGFMVPFARRAKAVVGQRAKVFVVGRILDVAMADRIVAEGAADMVALTRAHMADPFLVTKSREGRQREIVRCVGANVCVSRLVAEVGVTCGLNPAMGREREWGEGTLEQVNGGAKKRIAVVGGGPAGLRFAATARRRGHEVVLFERADVLGGHLGALSRLPTRENWVTGIDNLVRPVQDTGVEVRLSTERAPNSSRMRRSKSVVRANGSAWDTAGYSPMRPERDAIPGQRRRHRSRRRLSDPPRTGRPRCAGRPRSDRGRDRRIPAARARRGLGGRRRPGRGGHPALLRRRRSARDARSPSRRSPPEGQA